MSTFTKTLDWYERIGFKYRVKSPLQWELANVGSGYWLTVPKDFQFDLSVPRWLTWLINPHNPTYLKAAALHDFALESNWERVSAAAVFNSALKAQGVNRWKRLAMVTVVMVWRWE